MVECHAASWDELGVSRERLVEVIDAIGYRHVICAGGGAPDLRGARTTFHLLCRA
jgi:hypothetical protein